MRNTENINKFALLLINNKLFLLHIVREDKFYLKTKYKRNLRGRLDICKPYWWWSFAKTNKPSYILFNDYSTAKSYYIKLLQKYFNNYELLSDKFEHEIDQLIREMKILKLN